MSRNYTFPLAPMYGNSPRRMAIFSCTNPAAVLFRRFPTRKSCLDRFFPLLGVHFPPKRYAVPPYSSLGFRTKSF